ncbi:hypothetical protein CIW83_11795 [Tissierella sp. P1]|uniref:hypothetical protein n=1 Tax=Tissierella sp. P1 TaxID=1280483 RepID=UPI000BA0484E|nr:hypothetical protein [Tissierella sp. P1]OZV11926.1 hypothetical protein CIW83_11795 [Tissierella sp. P1]
MDKIENNIDRKITRYLVQFNDSMYDFHKKIEKSNDYKENNLDTKNVYKGYYEVQKRYISKTGDIIKDITEYSFGEINQELYESVYDSYDNILRKEIYQNRISNYGIEENIRKFIYKNIYEDNRLIRTVEIDVDDDYKEVSITDYEYENNLLIKKNNKRLYR